MILIVLSCTIRIHLLSVQKLSLNNEQVFTETRKTNNYTVTFNKNASSATGTMSVQTLTYNTSANLSSCGFARTGYTFAGWSTNSNGTGTVYANAEEVLNLTATSNSNTADAVAALVSLGFTQAEASVAIGKLDPNLSVDQLIKQGLRSLSKF